MKTKKRVTIRNMKKRYLIKFGGDIVDTAKTKSEARNKANAFRDKIRRDRR